MDGRRWQRNRGGDVPIIGCNSWAQHPFLAKLNALFGAGWAAGVRVAHVAPQVFSTVDVEDRRDFGDEDVVLLVRADDCHVTAGGVLLHLNGVNGIPFPTQDTVCTRWEPRGEIDGDRVLPGGWKLVALQHARLASTANKVLELDPIQRCVLLRVI